MARVSFCLLMLGVLSGFFSDAGELRSRIFRLPLGFQPSGLAVSSSDHVLVWQREGIIRIADVDGHWLASRSLALGVLRPRTATVQGIMPLDGIRDVVADADGFLVLATSGGVNEFQVIALDGLGEERGRWQVQDVRSIFSDGRKRHVINGFGFVELLSGSMLGQRQFLYSETEWQGRFSFLLSSRAGLVTCLAADLTKANHAPDVCWPLYGAGWRYTGDASISPPLVCGNWLVVRSGALQAGIKLINLADGKPAVSRDFLIVTETACLNDRQLIVAGKDVQVVSLPGLQTVWSSNSTGRAVDALGAGQCSIAWLRQNESALTLLRLTNNCRN